MSDISIRDIAITTLIAVSSILIVFPLQLLLCFKTKKLLLRLLPSLLLTVTTVFLFIMIRVTTDWDAFGYAILFVFSVIEICAFSNFYMSCFLLKSYSYPVKGIVHSSTTNSHSKACSSFFRN